MRAGAQLEQAAIEERERFCDTLGRDDDMPQQRPFALSGSMWAQLVVDQWVDPELLPQLQQLSRRIPLDAANRSKASRPPAVARAGDQPVHLSRALSPLLSAAECPAPMLLILP